MFLYRGYQEAKARRAQESESTQKTSESTAPTKLSPDEEPSDKKGPGDEPPLSTELEAHLESMTRETLESIPSKRPAPSDPEVVQASPRRRRRETSPAPRPRPTTGTQPSVNNGEGKTKYAGWPSDATERKTLNVEDLDLEKSYVGSITLPTPKPKGERPTRWKHPGKEPLTDPARLPKGWTTEEPDLDEE